MAEFINHNSFLILSILLEFTLIWNVIRRGINTSTLALLLVGSILIVFVFLWMRPDQNSEAHTQGYLSQIGNGMPVLLEIKSPN